MWGAGERTEQWTVGQLRAELVGVPDEIPVAIYIAAPTPDGFVTRHPLTGAGYGAGVDATRELLREEFPLLGGPGPSSS